MSQKHENEVQNRCRRCNKPLSNPNDIYGWRCLEIIEGGGEEETWLDKITLMSYNKNTNQKELLKDNNWIQAAKQKYDNLMQSNPVTKAIKTIIDWHEKKPQSYDQIWHAAAICLGAYGWKMSADLVWLSACGSGNTYKKGPGSYASELLKNDKGVRNKIKKIIYDDGISKRIKKINSEPESYEIPLSNGDLGASLHNVSIQVDAVQQDDGKWDADVTVTDKFDFTQFKNPFKEESLLDAALWAANDVALFYSKLGLLDIVEVEITFNDIY